MQLIDQLISAKYIITCEENNRVLEHHTLAIHEDKIVALLPHEEAKNKYKSKSERHYPHSAILPGLINAHTHLAMNLFRGMADDLVLMDWLKNTIWPKESKWMSNGMVYDGALLAVAEMIRGGTLCFNDMYFFAGTAEAAIKAGMRGFVGMTIMEIPNAWAKTIDESFEKAIEFNEEYKNHPLITPILSPHSTYTLSLKNLERVKRIADETKLRVNIHLQEAPAEVTESYERYQRRPLQRLNDIGLVSEQLIAVHMTQIDEDDFRILQEKKPNIVHCPESNMKLVSGACPVDKLLNLGINVALGTDGAASNNDLDMLGEMRTAAFLGKITANDPRAIAAETALKMATLYGARALGMDHLIGSLEPNKRADFIVIDFNHIETQPLYHPISQIVYATPRTQVTDAWVNGNQILKDRHLTHCDEHEIMTKALSWREKMGS